LVNELLGIFDRVWIKAFAPDLELLESGFADPAVLKVLEDV
jgi:hypothetical protein